MTPHFVSSLLIAYLLGSIPFAYLIARWTKGIDIRAVGDGNPGAKNVFEQISPTAGVVVGLLDIGKGVAALLVARTLGLSETALLWIGVAAMVGHNWSLFLHFQGGQGMATTVGVFLVLLPQETLAALLVIAVMLWLVRHWDIACGIGFASLPLWMWWTARPLELFLYVIAFLPLIGVRKWVQRAGAPRGDFLDLRHSKLH